MSNLLQLQSGHKAYGTKVLFDEASFAINDDEHVGVIGPNGAGKTTLFKILTGQESLDGGVLVKTKQLRVGYLAQHDEWEGNESVESYLSRGCRMPLWELKSLGNDLGISDEIYERPVVSLSGGYRMRCKLLYLLGQEPELMLLDEPTNYLDLETTLVLEKFLQGYKGAFLLISHDREFLRRTTDHILEVEQGDIIKYNGNLDDYFEQKTLLRSQLEARAMSLKEKRDEVLKFVARFGAKASKAKQAQSRLKSLGRMETIELKSLPVGASIKIPEPSRAGKTIITLEKAQLGYGERTIIKDVNFTLHNGDHLAVVGLNGAGKSTFLKTLAGVIPPLSGRVELGYQVSIGYYAQHVAENLDANATVLDEMTAKVHSEVSRQDALNMAGSLLFSGDDVKKKISVLSGGEKSRVALGQILLQRAPCLILDEPTNHLDFQTVEALTQSLAQYAGTLVVVSHDRSFIRRIGKKIVEVNNGEASTYLGTYDEYVWSLQKGSLSQRKLTLDSKNSKPLLSSPVAPKKIESFVSRTDRDRELKRLERNIQKLDERLEILQKKLLALSDSISDSGAYATKFESIKELELVQKSIESVEAEWMSECEKRDFLLKS